MTLGEKIQKLRKAAGLSQEQLASMIDMSRQAISKWETDQSVPDVDKVLLLCETFHISTDELLGKKSGSQSDQQDTKLEECVKMNFQKRCFTAGWLTSLTGVVLLVAEYFALFFLRNEAIRLDYDTNIRLGFYSDAMKYASVAPMPTIFGITIAVIVIGAATAISSVVFTYFMQKRKNK